MTFTPSTFWQNETEYVDSLEEHVTPPGEDHRAVSYRALLGFDEHDYDGPDYEMAAPVISLDDMDVVFGHDSERHDGLLNRSAVNIIRHHGLEFFERYVRIFHGGNVRQFHDYDGRRTYVTYDTAAMREAYWGADAGSEPSDLKASDFESWVNGETFWVAVEHTFEYDKQGEPVWDNAIEDERTHGFYGTLYAQQEAEEMLDHYTSGDAPEKALAAHRAEQRKRRVVVTLDFKESWGDPEASGTLSNSPLADIVEGIGQFLADEDSLDGFDIEIGEQK
jgi:hypothetical protein